MKFYPLVLINSTWKYEIVIIFNLGKKESIGGLSTAMIKQVTIRDSRNGKRTRRENKQPIVGSKGLFFFFFFLCSGIDEGEG
jgi:dihydroorotate dehydrogenase